MRWHFEDSLPGMQDWAGSFLVSHFRPRKKFSTYWQNLHRLISQVNLCAHGVFSQLRIEHFSYRQNECSMLNAQFSMLS